MATPLSSLKVAVLATHGFEQSELFSPRKALDAAGAITHVVSPETGEIKGWDQDDWGRSVSVDVPLPDADPSAYDALLLPGGQMNPDTLRADQDAMAFIRHFVENDKPIAAICHAPWLLIEADAVRGRRMTSYASIQTDMKNAGADWVDQEVVVDGRFVTSRKPDDLPAFNEKTIEVFSEVAASA